MCLCLSCLQWTPQMLYCARSVVLQDYTYDVSFFHIFHNQYAFILNIKWSDESSSSRRSLLIGCIKWALLVKNKGFLKRLKKKRKRGVLNHGCRRVAVQKEKLIGTPLRAWRSMHMHVGIANVGSKLRLWTPFPKKKKKLKHWTRMWTDQMIFWLYVGSHWNLTRLYRSFICIEYIKIYNQMSSSIKK